MQQEHSGRSFVAATGDGPLDVALVVQLRGRPDPAPVVKSVHRLFPGHPINFRMHVTFDALDNRAILHLSDPGLRKWRCARADSASLRRDFSASVVEAFRIALDAPRPAPPPSFAHHVWFADGLAIEYEY